MISLSPGLESPFEVGGKVAVKVMLDLTLYLVGPTEEEFEFLFDFYEQCCPADRRRMYKISELQHWTSLENPRLTESGRQASTEHRKRPYFEPTRNRIREGRAFEASIWDGRPIEDPAGSWSFRCRRTHLRSSGLHAFVRILLPLKSDLEVLKQSARGIGNRVQFYSGHGGLVFAYEPWFQIDAFDEIYAKSRRYWGIDIEDLNRTLPLMTDAIKGVNWLTLIGEPFRSPELDSRFDALSDPHVTVEDLKHGKLITAGEQPVTGDQHRPDGSLVPYVAIADALTDLFVDEHDDFPGPRFIENGNTAGWLRRFIEPDGWR